MKIIEEKSIFKYLKKRGLLTQYKKAKNNIEAGLFDKVKFKKRKPGSHEIFQFRINKKYRAFGVFHDQLNKIFKVIEINDHQ
jgi:hypothetical protein